MIVGKGGETPANERTCGNGRRGKTRNSKRKKTNERIKAMI
jgi:hypothetical protein